MINYTQLPIFSQFLQEIVPTWVKNGTEEQKVFIIYALAATIYLAVSIHLYLAVKKRTATKPIIGLVGLSIGMVLHAILLYPSIVTQQGLNFNIFNTLSLTALFFLVFFIIFGLYRPIISLGLLAAPTAFIGLSAGYFGRATYEPLVGLSPPLEIHIVLSLAAYCVLLMACVQAIILRLQIRELKHQSIHRFWVSRLPALQSMENLLFDMILLGFVLLSFALVLGLIVTYDLIAQHIAHKFFFSILSWFVFGWLIFGHYYYGWNGKRATNMTIYGFILLAIGFFGSKAVLELILAR